MLIRIKDKSIRDQYPLLTDEISVKSHFTDFNFKGYKFKSVLVEGRITNNLKFTILNTYNSLPTYFDHIIFCSNVNFNFINRILKENDIQHKFEIIKLDFEINRNTYNNLLLTIDFWESLDCDKVLIYQTDTFIFKEFDDCFIEEKFIGASSSLRHKIDFINQKFGINGYRRIMNGGLSYRDVNVMIDKLNDDPYNILYKPLGILDKIEEDLYFSLYVEHNTKSQCLKFAYEEYSSIKNNIIRFDKIDLFGCHAYHHYYNEEIFKRKWSLGKFKN